MSQTDYSDEQEYLIDPSEVSAYDAPDEQEYLVDPSEVSAYDAHVPAPVEPTLAEVPVVPQKTGFVTKRRMFIAGVLAAAVGAAGAAYYFGFHKKSRPGSEFMEEYAAIPADEKDLGGGNIYADYGARQIATVAEIDKGNITSSSEKFVTVSVEGPKGTKVEYEIMIHEIRIGNDESFYMVPLDGPHSLAACKVLGLELPTRWMAHELRRKIFKEGGKLGFIAEPAIKLSLGEQSEANERDWSRFGKRKGPQESESPKLIKAHGDLFMKYLNQMQMPKEQRYGYDAGTVNAEAGTPSDDAGTPLLMNQKDYKILNHILIETQLAADQPVSGHFKEVIQDPLRPTDKLSTYRGCEGKEPVKNWAQQPNFGCALWADVHPARFFDYSHGVRCVKPEMTVWEKPKGKEKDTEPEKKEMTMHEFYANKDYRAEFMLGNAPLRVPAYELPPALIKWLEDNGHKEVTEKGTGGDGSGGSGGGKAKPGNKKK